MPKRKPIPAKKLRRLDKEQRAKCNQKNNGAIYDIPLSIEKFTEHTDALRKSLDDELGKDVVEKLLRDRPATDFGFRFTLRSIASEFRGVNAMEIWRLDDNVRLHGKKPKTSAFYEKAGRYNKPCFAKGSFADCKSLRDAKNLTDEFEALIRCYLGCLNACARMRVQKQMRSVISVRLLRLLSGAWLEDPKVLREFLSKMFLRWNKIDASGSIHRKRVAINEKSLEVGRDPKQLQDHLESIRAVSKSTFAGQQTAARNWISQYFSRDLRKLGQAARRRQKMRDIAQRTSRMSKAKRAAYIAKAMTELGA